MKKNLILAAFASLIICCAFVGHDAFGAASRNYWTCLSQSGGREDIPSVQWACDGWADEGVQHCSLWLGPSGNSKSLTIEAEISSIYDSISATFYGMCTSGSSGTKYVWAENDGGSIKTINSMSRGEWGSPGSGQSTTISVNKFINGASSWQSGDYTYYQRTVTIGRCHSTYTGTDYMHETSGKCSRQDQVITLKIKMPTTTFTGSVSASASSYGYDSSWSYSGGKYYTDSSSAYVSFVHNITRNGDGASGSVDNSWSTTNSKSGWSTKSAGVDNSGTHSFTQWQSRNVYTPSNISVTLNDGDNTFCQQLTYSSKVNYDGTSASRATAYDCVTIHKYRWDTWEGRVTPTASGTSGKTYNNIYYVDADTANLTFKHELKRSNGTEQTRFYTTKDSTLGSSFPTQSEKDSNVSGTGWNTVFNSPSSPASVNVAINNGTQYCENLYWMRDTREDRGANYTGSDKIKNWTSTSGCITLRRYKTSFTGTIAVQYRKKGSSTWNTVYSAGASELTNAIVDVNDSTLLPQEVEVRFIHKVTRSNSDNPSVSTAKATVMSTNTTGSYGVRSGDTMGNPITDRTTTALSAGGSYEYTDTFTVNVYPEQEIYLCQYLSFKSELQGSQYTATGSAGKRCFKITRTHISCMDDDFGIKNAKNYLKMDIYKNGTSATSAKSTGRLDSGNTTIYVWARPEDTVRYKYTLCAAADLASQFNYNTSTKYTISTNKSGYLFGTTLSTAANNYAETSTVVGQTNTTAGVGPFKSGDVYLYQTNIYSPSDSANELYKCYSNNFRDDFYQIAGIYPAVKGDSCKSDDYGFEGDVGHIFSQTATWTDLWYSSGNVVSGHSGGDATATGQVRVPYNYKTTISTTAAGGRIILGHSIKFNVNVDIKARKNTQVDNQTYSTYTKPSKVQVLKITIGPDEVTNDEAKDFNDAINENEFKLADTSGDNFITQLRAAIGAKNSKFGGFNITSAGTVSNKVYQSDSSNEVFSNISLEIPDSTEELKVGSKVCYVAGIWPSDSHDAGNADINSEDQSKALTTDGYHWHMSSASCFTVAKRPSMAILNADAYAPGGILGITNERKYKGTDSKMIFGSWDEYGLVAGIQSNSSEGEIIGVASGASLYGGVKPYSDVVNKVCFFSGLTFTNDKCDKENLGKLPVDSTTASYPGRIADQMIARYTSRNDPDAKLSGGSTINSIGKCVSDGNGGFVPEGNGNYKCLSNGARYVHVTGDAEFTANFCLKSGSGGYSNTMVYDADGTMYINGDIIYGQVDEVTTRRAGGCYESTYSSMAEVPQVIVIAKKIVIRENVTHLDAWLIADEISTCDNANPGAGNCNKTLTVNGPVITKKLNLLRTAGGDGVVNGFSTNGKPAEVFYLGPETYLWSYSQATRFSQATTTYQRELAPRY